MFWRKATGCNPVSLRVYRPLALAAIPIAIFGTMMLLLHRPRSNFSNWGSTFHLAVGNELTGDRPWTGTISEFAIYPFAMAQSQISDLNRRRSGSYPSEPPIIRLVPTGSGRPLFSRAEELRLYDGLVRTNQLTLLVSMRTSNLEQIGPVRNHYLSASKISLALEYSCLYYLTSSHSYFLMNFVSPRATILDTGLSSIVDR